MLKTNCSLEWFVFDLLRSQLDNIRPGGVFSEEIINKACTTCSLSTELVFCLEFVETASKSTVLSEGDLKKLKRKKITRTQTVNNELL